ncbi:MAG: hypothetical protein HFI34_08470 [Lachnospiraceae bacterium]|nr:hypothetical protein [Lachnospiraceae bacterium]
MNKLIKVKQVIWFILLASMMFLQTAAVHAEDMPRLTVEQVKEEIEKYIKNDQKAGMTLFSPYEYDLEELCELNELFFMINDYIEGQGVKSIADTESDNENQYAIKWYLPFKNMSGKAGYLIFKEENGTVNWIESSLGTSQYYDMKVREGKYKGILLEEVEDEIYCNSAAYGFMFTYIKMKNGKEYVIPFINENISEWNSIVCKKIYTVQEFFTIMYRYYDEPTLEELIEQSETMDNTTSGSSYFRETPLDSNTVLPGSLPKQTDLAENNIFKVAAGSVAGICIINFTIRKKRKSY